MADAAAHFRIHRDGGADYTAWARMAVCIDYGGVDADDICHCFTNQRGDRALLHPASLDDFRFADGWIRQFRLPSAVLFVFS